MPTPFGPDDYSNTIVGTLFITLILILVFGGLAWAYLNGWAALGIVFLIGYGSMWVLSDMRDNWEKWR